MLQCRVCKHMFYCTHKKAKTLNSLVEFLIRCLQHDRCSINVYHALLYIRYRVPGDLKCLADIQSKGLYVHFIQAVNVLIAI